MVKIYFILLMTFSSVYAEDMVNLAINEYQKGNSPKAITILKEISSQSGQFKRSIETLMKIYYRERTWPRVFGLGTFYRHHFNNHPDFSMDIASLEILGLAQNCQYDIATRVLKSLAETHGEKSGFKALLKNFKIAKNYGFKEDKLEANKPSKASKEERWKLGANEFNRLRDPYRLEVKVENKCKN